MMKGKKGVSNVIGYVLLISIAVVLSLVVFLWLKSYIPRDTPECPNDVSVFIEYIEGETNLSITNNGLFNIDGVYIRGSTNEDKKPTIDLTNEEEKYIHFEGGLKPNDKKDVKLVYEDIGEIAIIEVVPFRFQLNEETNENEFTVCGNAKVTEKIGEGIDPSTFPEGNAECCDGCSLGNPSISFTNLNEITNKEGCKNGVVSNVNEDGEYWTWTCNAQGGEAECSANYEEALEKCDALGGELCYDYSFSDFCIWGKDGYDRELCKKTLSSCLGEVIDSSDDIDGKSVCCLGNCVLKPIEMYFQGELSIYQRDIKLSEIVKGYIKFHPYDIWGEKRPKIDYEIIKESTNSVVYRSPGSVDWWELFEWQGGKMQMPSMRRGTFPGIYYFRVKVDDGGEWSSNEIGAQWQDLDNGRIWQDLDKGRINVIDCSKVSKCSDYNTQTSCEKTEGQADATGDICDKKLECHWEGDGWDDGECLDGPLTICDEIISCSDYSDDISCFANPCEIGDKKGSCYWDRIESFSGSCRLKLDNGENCNYDEACQSNYCVDGVCCDTACEGDCRVCDGSIDGSSAGVCSQKDVGESCSEKAEDYIYTGYLAGTGWVYPRGNLDYNQKLCLTYNHWGWSLDGQCTQEGYCQNAMTEILRYTPDIHYYEDTKIIQCHADCVKEETCPQTDVYPAEKREHYSDWMYYCYGGPMDNELHECEVSSGVKGYCRYGDCKEKGEIRQSFLDIFN